MRILVTGGAGFLGSHICEKLLFLGHEVIALDNYYTGTRKNIENMLANSNFEIIRHDVSFPIYIEVDGILNFACPASPIHYQRFPVQTTKTSVLGAINMLGLAKRLRIPILQASTSEIYGDPEISPQTENYPGKVNPIGIRACYDEGKRVAETLFYDYFRQFNLSIKILRIFNTYGPRMNFQDGRVVSNFIIQALRNQNITIYGDGNQTRSFCYVDDMVDGILKYFFDESGEIGPINIGNPHEITVLDLAKKIVSLTNSTSRISFHDLPQDDPKQRKPNVDLAKKILAWQPNTSLDQGLMQTIDDFRKRM